MYTDKIIEIAEKTGVFTTNTIRKIAKVPENKYAVFNTEIARLEKAGKLSRLGKGVYAYVSDTVFGTSLPTHAEVVKLLYISDGNGYTYGPTFFNQIGLSTWVPKNVHVKTLNCITIIPPGYLIKKAPENCNVNNMAYFQLLDCIKDIEKLTVDASNPDEVIRNYIEKTGLDKAKLAVYCNRYYKSTLPKLMEIMEGYYL